MDEKLCRLPLHHQQVLAKKGTQIDHIIATQHAKNATTVACGYALGQAFPLIMS